ncbi:hypothetical protein [Egbenema bharatensis]|uniref:hypothetical protein n=1 Tax=Egbenema bharatensis TaxID=3463334 RepID=UPI003A840A4C
MHPYRDVQFLQSNWYDFNLFAHPTFGEDADPSAGRERVRIIIFGSKEVVRATIHDLYPERYKNRTIE